jgi:hypothetical protein
MDLSTAITRIVLAPSPSRFSPLACFVSLPQSASEIPKRDTQNPRSQTRYQNYEGLKEIRKRRVLKRDAQLSTHPPKRDVKIHSFQKRCPNSEVLNKIHKISRSQTGSINTEVPKSSVRLLMTLGSETRVRKNWEAFIYLPMNVHVTVG